MHIIGIEIEEGCETEVIKNLRPEWYPFGDYIKPTKDNQYRWRNGSEQSDRLYQIIPNLPTISVSCVVGKNGSGKTTLIGILYRIINNFSYDIKPLYSETSYDSFSLEWVKGIKACLYFEIDGNVGYIRCDEDNSRLFYKVNADGNLNEISKDRYIEILPELFYTIGINYSIHSMDFEEYPAKKNEWMKRIYDNEEAYLVPLAFTPYRRNGQIDMDKERNDANYRVIVLSILLYMDEKRCLINNYVPEKINYSLITEYKKSRVSKLEDVMIRRGFPIGIAEAIMVKFKSEWKSQFEKDNLGDASLLIEKSIEALAFESAWLSLTYKSYQDIFDLHKLQKISEKNGSAEEIANVGKYRDVVEKVRNKKDDSLTLNSHQILTFLKKMRSKSIGEKGDIFIDDLIDEIKQKYGSRAITYNDVYKLLPPSFFKCDLYIKRKDEQKGFAVAWLSSGEKQMLYSNSAALYHINNLANANADTRIIPYKHINIVYDEVELYSHPEFQRSYINHFISMIENLGLDTNRIQSINLIIATHSPFIVSDVPKENVLALENGKCKKMNEQTYCANIYDLLKNSFFLEYPMGEAARRKLTDIVRAFNDNNVELKEKICNNADFYTYLKSIIADRIIRDSMSMMIDSILDEGKKDIRILFSRKAELKRQIDQIDNEIRLINEDN